MRKVLLVALLAGAGCSYSEEQAQILLRVDAIPQAADHLDVVLTSSDTSVKGANCPTTVTAAPNSICYRPTFQPGSLNPPGIDLAFAQPANSGTFQIAVTASDRNASPLASGSVSGTLPGPVNLQLTLH